jgi:CBS domain-containing protein
MLKEPTIEKLHALRLRIMAAAWLEQDKSPDTLALPFDDRLALIVDAEALARDNKRLTKNLRDAKLRIANACIEGIEFSRERQLEKPTVRQLATCRWVSEHQTVLVTGATGTGKSYFGCALAHEACRKGFRALYRRVPRLFDELRLARADGTYSRLLARIAKIDVLVLDDFAIAPLTDDSRRRARGRQRQPGSARTSTVVDMGPGTSALERRMPAPFIPPAQKPARGRASEPRETPQKGQRPPRYEGTVFAPRTSEHNPSEQTMFVREIMTTRPVVIEVNESIGCARRKLRDADVRHLPVLDRGAVVGIISDRDIPVFEPDDVSLFDTRMALNQPVSSIMSSDLVETHPDCELTDAIDLMLEHRIGALPVVAPNTHELRGIISYVDVLKAARFQI